ncbi:MAG: hypothetical protein MUC84_06650, partial [Solirubrobacteraceae bacterium]|nr:hypothetical protein [Solirubrobacteraceae bacterium]
MRRIVGLLMVAVALVIVPAPARAATPFTVGQGVNPKIAVAPNGTGYVVWGIPERGSGTDAAIGFCRIPAGGTACDRLFTIEYPGTATNDVLSPGNVTVTAESDTRIRVTGSCWQCLGAGVTEAVVRFVSSNGGSTAPMGEPGLGTTPTTNGVGPDGI